MPHVSNCSDLPCKNPKISVSAQTWEHSFFQDQMLWVATHINFEWMNEWIMHLYCALLCIAIHPKRFTIMWGGLSSTTTSVQHPLDGISDDATAATGQRCQCAHQLQVEVERRESHGLIMLMGIIRRPWLIRASGGNLSRTPGLHPYSLQEVPWHF